MSNPLEAPGGRSGCQIGTRRGEHSRFALHTAVELEQMDTVDSISILFLPCKHAQLMRALQRKSTCAMQQCMQQCMGLGGFGSIEMQRIPQTVLG